MEAEHPSMLQAANNERLNYKIVNVTNEVIRDYFEESTNGVDDARAAEAVPLPSSSSSKETPPATRNGRDKSRQMAPFDMLRQTATHDSYSTVEDELVPSLELEGAQLVPSRELFLSPDYSDSTFEDGIFSAGSQYQELHAALRSRIIDTAKSTAPSRLGSPEIHQRSELYPEGSSETADDEWQRLAYLSVEQEFMLWQNYIE